MTLVINDFHVSCKLELRRVVLFILMENQLSAMILIVFFPTYSAPSFLGLWQMTREIRNYGRRQRKMGPVYLKCTVESVLGIQMCQRMASSWLFLSGDLSPLLSHVKIADVREMITSPLFSLCPTKDCQPLCCLSLWTLDLHCRMQSELRYVASQWRMKPCLHKTRMNILNIYVTSLHSHRKYGSMSSNETATDTKIKHRQIN
jgi:hypothetical protein